MTLQEIDEQIRLLSDFLLRAAKSKEMQKDGEKVVNQDIDKIQKSIDALKAERKEILSRRPVNDFQISPIRLERE